MRRNRPATALALAALLLGPVHRGVGVAQHLLAGFVTGMPHGDADARGREQLAAGDPDRRPQRGKHPQPEFLRHRRAIQAFGEDRVLVAAQARDHVGAAHNAPLAGTYFNMRKTTIYGGSNEVQRNIVSQVVLGS